MKQAVGGVLILLAIMSASVLVGVQTADAQPTCTEGTLVGELCQVEGRPPIQRAGTCPQGPDIVQAGCYRVTPVDGNGQCPGHVAHVVVGSECRSAVAIVPGPLVCPDAGYEVQGDRCVGYINPVCGPQGCRGEITQAYTIGCVGTGLSRVQLATPVLTNGARISLITVNGSATIGADLTAGSTVSVVITPERSNDVVSVSGPSIAPDCGAAAVVPPAATATPTPTATPRPAAPPAPARATPTESPVVADPSPAGEDPTPTPVPTSTPPVAVAAQPSCPVGHVLVDAHCVPPCTTAPAGVECFDIATSTMTQHAPQSPVASASVEQATNDLPVVPLAIVGAATVVLAPTAYFVVHRRFG